MQKKSYCSYISKSVFVDRKVYVSALKEVIVSGERQAIDNWISGSDKC